MTRSRLRVALIWAGAMAASALLLYLWLGPLGLLPAAIGWGLALVWKFDNWSGSCLMLTILALIAVSVPMLLLVLIALNR